jgi:hypothetical protein
MTNTRTIKKTNHYFRMLAVLVAMLAAMLVGSGVARAVSLGFSNPSPIQIVDNGPANPYPSHVNVQGVPGKITDVDVTLPSYSHTFPDDVDVLLVGPKGQKALLMSDVGGDNAVNGVILKLDDESSNFLPDSYQITTGPYKPTQGTVPANFPDPAPAGPYATNLSVFDGTDPNGTWDLYVLDDSGADIGQFAGGWGLSITTDGTADQIDTTPPRVESTNPAPGATGVSPTASVKAAFSEEIKLSTINGTTFKLFRKGSTTKVGATVSYDGSSDRNTATLDPTNSLMRGVTYKAVVTTDARDLVGNRLDQNSTLTGLQQKVWTFTVRP